MLNRLGKVEATVSDVRIRVGEVQTTLTTVASKLELGKVEAGIEKIQTMLANVATKTDVEKVHIELSHLATKTDMEKIRVELPHLATKDDVSKSGFGLVKWFVTTIVSTAAVVFAIAKVLAKWMPG